MPKRRGLLALATLFELSACALVEKFSFEDAHHDLVVLGALPPPHSSPSHCNTNLSIKAILAALGRVECNWICHLFVTRAPPWEAN